MNWYQQAAERLKEEYKSVTGSKESAMKGAVRDTLLEFCRQNEEFAQAVVQGGAFKDCMAAVAKGVGGSISDLEAYRDALLKEAFEAIGIDKYNIVIKTWEIFQRCAEGKPVLEWDRDQREWVPSGLWQFDSKGALRALDMLAKLLPGLRQEEDQGPSYEDLLGEE